MIFNSGKTRNAKEEANQCKISIGNVTIDRVAVFKFLGVHVDEALAWKDHVSNVTKKVAKGIGILKRTSPVLEEKQMRMLYNSLILPHLNYCNIIWGNTYESTLKPLVTMQKSAIKLIAQAGFREHTPPLFHRLGVLQLADINFLQNTIFAYKHKNLTNLLPKPLQQIFQLNKNKYNYDTRGAN